MRLRVAVIIAASLGLSIAVTSAAERSNRSSSAVTSPPTTSPLAMSVPTLRVDEARALGKASATIALVEFSDYQCPYCARFDAETLPQIVKAYVDTGIVRYFHKDMPLPMHRQAIPASVAARCAGEQGRFWQMHRRLYERQRELSVATYEELAASFSLDPQRFQACRNNENVRRAIEQDAAEARVLQLTGTPSFVLGRIDNGKVVVERTAKGALKFDVFAREIEALRASAPGAK